MELAVDHAHGLVSRLYEHCSGRVSEEGACGPVLIVGHARHFLGAYHHDFLVETAFDVSARGLHRHNKSRAGSLYVVGIGVCHAAAIHYHRGGGGKR